MLRKVCISLVFVVGWMLGKVYELLYGECSRIFCTPQKELDNKVKLWREVNDGLYWARKGCKPEKEQFGIVGIQIAGYKLYICLLVPYKLIFFNDTKLS